MRTLARPMVSLLALAALFGATPSPGRAQSVVVGGVGGANRSRELLERAADSELRNGFVVGAWVDVETPKPPLHVLAEAAYARRGGRYPLGGASGLTGVVESDWVAVTVAPVFHVGIGPLAAYAYGGPTLEMPVRTRTAAELQNVYAAPSDQELSVTAGAGLEGRMDGWSVRGEARIVQGLSSSYSGSAGDIRHRSVEMVMRVGRRTQGPSAPMGTTAMPSSRRYP
ncbi:MAG TPA: hypothetical protein VLH75_05945 [Longimicrobiales bacterium]|nr:hypothetical protein [Longimicrobiales bacterium]